MKLFELLSVLNESPYPKNIIIDVEIYESNKHSYMRAMSPRLLENHDELQNYDIVNINPFSKCKGMEIKIVENKNG